MGKLHPRYNAKARASSKNIKKSKPHKAGRKGIKKLEDKKDSSAKGNDINGNNNVNRNFVHEEISMNYDIEEGGEIYTAG